MSGSLTIQVAPGLAAWSHGDTTIEAGQAVSVRANAELRAAVAAAVDAGSLLLVDGDVPKGAVESERDSLHKQQAADKARHALFEERDRALLAGEDPQEWHVRVEEAAQAAAEGV